MTYSLESNARASKEWHKLGATVRQQLKKKLATVLVDPGLRPIVYIACLTVTISSYVAGVLLYQVSDHEVLGSIRGGMRFLRGLSPPHRSLVLLEAFLAKFCSVQSLSLARQQFAQWEAYRFRLTH